MKSFLHNYLIRIYPLLFMLFACQANAISLEQCSPSWQEYDINYRFNHAIWHNGQYIGVGDKGLIATSIDGINWVEQSSPTNNKLSRIVFLDSSYVVVGDKGIVLLSSNASQWETVLVDSSDKPVSINDIAWNGQTFIAIGDDIGIWKSEDLKSWTVIQAPNTSFNSPDNQTIIWDGSQFILATKTDFFYPTAPYIVNPVPHLNARSLILTSPQGRKWALQANDLLGINRLFKSGEMALGVGGQHFGLYYDRISRQSIYLSRNNHPWSLVYRQSHTRDDVYVPPPINAGYQPMMQAYEFVDVIYWKDTFIALQNNGSIFSSQDASEWYTVLDRFDIQIENPEYGQLTFNYSSIIANSESLIALGDKQVLLGNCIKNEPLETIDHYRLYNVQEKSYFFTIDEVQKNALIQLDWRDEGVHHKLLKKPLANSLPLKRLHHPSHNSRFWLADKAQIKALKDEGWQEGAIDGYVFNQPIKNTIALYQLKHPGSFYLWTSSQFEYRLPGWEVERLVGYVPVNPSDQAIYDFVYALYGLASKCKTKTEQNPCDEAPESSRIDKNCIDFNNEIYDYSEQLFSKTLSLSELLAKPRFINTDLSKAQTIELSFQALLGRSPSEEEIDFYQQQFKSMLSLESIYQHLKESTQMQAKFNALTILP